MNNSTSQIARDAMWARRENFANERIAASQPTCLYRFALLTVTDIRNRAEFVVREPLKVQSPNGTVTLRAMMVLISEYDRKLGREVKSCYEVRAVINDGAIAEWQVTAPCHRKHNAMSILDAVRQRVAAQKASVR